jgi:thioredoxin reductase (NADPH)
MIRNYPGFPHGVSGYELTRRACEQTWMFGAHMVFAQHVAGRERHGDRLAVCLDNGHRVTAGRETGRTCSTIAKSPAM